MLGSDHDREFKHNDASGRSTQCICGSALKAFINALSPTTAPQGGMSACSANGQFNCTCLVSRPRHCLKITNTEIVRLPVLNRV